MTSLDSSVCRGWLKAVVLLTVCALGISVATRYGTTTKSAGPVVTVHKHFAAERGRQRLLKNATPWIPPVVVTSVLQDPASYPRIADTRTSVPVLVLDRNLYNRPPPSGNPSSYNIGS